MRCLLRGRLPARGDQATAAASNFVARDCRERPAPVTFTHEIVASGVGSTFFSTFRASTSRPFCCFLFSRCFFLLFFLRFLRQRMGSVLRFCRQRRRPVLRCSRQPTIPVPCAISLSPHSLRKFLQELFGSFGRRSTGLAGPLFV